MHLGATAGSQIYNWQIAIHDTIADNAPHGVFALGDTAIYPTDLDLAALQMNVLKNSQALSSAPNSVESLKTPKSVVQGNPLTVVAGLAGTVEPRMTRHGDVNLSFGE